MRIPSVSWQETPASPEVEAESLFLKSLRQHHLPIELDVDTVVEALSYHDHFPVVHKLLALFGTSSQTTFSSESAATHCDPNFASQIAQSYAFEWQNASKPKPTVYPHPHHNARLQTLCASYDPQWLDRGLGQKIQYLLGEIFSKRLGYNLDVEANNSVVNQSGDYHLIIQWLRKHIKEIELIFFDKGNIESMVAKIAHSKFVTVNQQTANILLAAWESILGPVDLEAVRITKGKNIDPTQEAFPRVKETSVVRAFRQLFVDLDLTGITAVAEYLGIDPEDMGEDGLTHFAQQMNILHLMMLGLIQDTKSNYQPLQQLAKHLKQPLSQILTLLIEAATTQPTSPNRHNLLTAINSALQNQNLIEIITKLTQNNMNLHSGFGAARALLVCYTQLKLNHDLQAEPIEKLMYYFTQLALNPNVKESLNLQAFIQTTQ